MTPLQLHDIVIRRGRRVIVDRVSTTIAAGTSQALRNLLMNLMGMKATK